MSAMPDEIPLTNPKASTVAIDVFVLLHTPELVISDKLVVSVVHRYGEPVIGAGTGFTVIVALVIQPVPNV